MLDDRHDAPVAAGDGPTAKRAPARSRAQPTADAEQPEATQAQRLVPFLAGVGVLLGAVIADSSVMFGTASVVSVALQAVALAALFVGLAGLTGARARRAQLAALVISGCVAYVANQRLSPRIESLHERSAGAAATGHALLRNPEGRSVRFPLRTLEFTYGELEHMGRILPVAQLYMGGAQGSGDAMLRLFGTFPRARSIDDLVHKELALSVLDFNRTSRSLIRFPGADSSGEVVQGRVQLIDISRRGVAEKNAVRIVGRIFMNVDMGGRIDAVSGRFEGYARWSAPVAAGLF